MYEKFTCMTILIYYVNYRTKILKTKNRLDKNKFKAVIFFHDLR